MSKHRGKQMHQASIAIQSKGGKTPKPIRVPLQDRIEPTPERMAKGDIVAGDHRIGRGEDWKGARSIGGRPIDRYRREGIISEAQHKAGTRHRADWMVGEGSQRLIALYGERSSDGKGELTDAQAERRHDYVMATQALGPELGPVVVHVVIMEKSAKSWAEERGRRGTGANAEGMVTLRLALDRLARYYGLTR